VIIDVEDVSAIEIRWAVTIPQIERVVSIVKQAQSALLIKRA